MPSPFPGMDPFIERGYWQTFHNRLITAVGDHLVPQVRPKYAVDIAQDIYLVRDDATTETRAPDLTVIRDRPGERRPAGRESEGGVLTESRRIPGRIPIAHERQHWYLEVRDVNSREVLTAVEVLSPTNKIDRKGRKKYLRKRQDLIASGVNLVELDLLRAGRPLPVDASVPAGHYVAIVCRVAEAPNVDVYPWSLRERLPVIPIPLGGEDADAIIDLQRAFDEAYDRVGFAERIRYREPLEPPLQGADQEWLDGILKGVPSN